MHAHEAKPFSGGKVNAPHRIISNGLARTHRWQNYAVSLIPGCSATYINVVPWATEPSQRDGFAAPGQHASKLHVGGQPGRNGGVGRVLPP